jgi:transposase
VRRFVKAYVKRNKNDAADAAAICEAVMRPTMRFVPIKTADQQAAVLLHRGRERLVASVHGTGERFARAPGGAGVGC